jgi:DNA-binding response OmpR family regulator
MRILLVEDERQAAQLLAKGLREQSYAVDIAADGEAALLLAHDNDYDLIVLDVMLPRKDGLTVCRELRAARCAVPVLMLTARDALQDRVAGLDTGADDYLVKPFAFQELLARVRALLRRGPVLQPTLLTVADLVIDTHTRNVRRGGQLIPLTTKEYALLEYLARRAGALVTRAEIAEHVWDDSYDPFSNLIEVYMQRLRRKLDEGREPKLLHTQRGAGYALAVKEEGSHD